MNLKLLKADIDALEYTQTEIGLLIGYEQSSVSKMLSGTRKLTVEVFEKLCKLAKTPPSKYLHKDPLKQQIYSRIYDLDNNTLLALLNILNLLK